MPQWTYITAKQSKRQCMLPQQVIRAWQITKSCSEAGYPSDFDEYPDSLVGYTTLKDTYGGNDIMVGGWGMSGSDSGNAVIMKEDNNKFIKN